MFIARLAPLAVLLALGGCAYDGATGYAPEGYPPGYDSGMGSGLVSQPGDRFGGQNVASVEVFTEVLAPYGQWVDSKFGRAFRPDAPQDWRPYVNGQWGENRLWVSNDPWGWATDHYGRWGFDERAGWVWVPGTEWAPSWVAFREDPAQNVAGWAPVPPGVNYSINLGFGSGFGYDNYANWYGPSWVWVPQSYLYRPGFGGRVLPWNYGASYWGGSRFQYQPGFGGRPAYRPQPGGWQGRPQQGRPGYGQPRPPGGNYQGRSPQGGNWQGRPPQNAYTQPRQPQNGSWQGRPMRETLERGGRRGISAGDGAVQPNAGRPVMTYADRPAARPAPAPPQQRPQYVERPPQAQPQPQPRPERQELQRQVQAQPMRADRQGNKQPD